jgi:hypothetical protein
MIVNILLLVATVWAGTTQSPPAPGPKPSDPQELPSWNARTNERQYHNASYLTVVLILALSMATSVYFLVV